MGLWIASLILYEVLNGVEYHVIFNALRDQAASDEKIALLLDLYQDQTGCANKVQRCNISRGKNKRNSLGVL